MKNPNNSVAQQMNDNSDLFWKLQKKHGRYFIEELRKHERIILGTFAIMKTQELRELVCCPDYYFTSLVREELTKRKTKARLLKARGRLCRKVGQVC